MLGARVIVVLVAGLIPIMLTLSWVGDAQGRLETFQQERAGRAARGESDVAVAESTDAQYCTPELKKILRRVLQSCGLLGKGEGRGCQPLEARNVATVSGSDFNALFQPMKERGGIVQFEVEAADLDDSDRMLVDKVFSDQKGASYFFVVARASPEGAVRYNRELSRKRAEAVMSHLRTQFDDPDLDREVGLLWLGEEFAQLDQAFCDWRRSDEISECNTTTINRGAFMAWIDCVL